MKINEEILKKANEIIAAEKVRKKEAERAEKIKANAVKQLNKYRKTCIEAKICPVCGGILDYREPTEEETVESHYDYNIETIFCKDSENHFTEVIGEYADYEDEA